MEDHKTYRDGVVDGRIQALEETQAKMQVELKEHKTHTNNRITNLEKMVWIASGTVLAVTLLPELKALLT